MLNPTFGLATRGILNPNGMILPMGAYTIISITTLPPEIPPTPPMIEFASAGAAVYGGGGVGSPIQYTRNKGKKLISVKIDYEGEIYETIQEVRKDIEVTAENIEVELLETGKPTIRIIFADNE